MSKSTQWQYLLLLNAKLLGYDQVPWRQKIEYVCHTYTTSKFPWDYEPTVFDNIFV